MYMSTTLTDLPIELFGTVMELGIRIPQRAAAIAIQRVWRGALARGVPANRLRLERLADMWHGFALAIGTYLLMNLSRLL